MLRSLGLAELLQYVPSFWTFEFIAADF